jgi:hypothetical protein
MIDMNDNLSSSAPCTIPSAGIASRDNKVEEYAPSADRK